MARYEQVGISIKLVDDDVHTNGLSWSAADLNFNSVGDHVEIASPALHTPLSAPFNLGGMYYCKLVSPARFVEWFLTDGLPKVE